MGRLSEIQWFITGLIVSAGSSGRSRSGVANAIHGVLGVRLLLTHLVCAALNSLEPRLVCRIFHSVRFPLLVSNKKRANPEKKKKTKINPLDSVVQSVPYLTSYLAS